MSQSDSAGENYATPCDSRAIIDVSQSSLATEHQDQLLIMVQWYYCMWKTYTCMDGLFYTRLWLNLKVTTLPSP